MADVQVEDATGSLSKTGNHDGDDIHTRKGQSGNPNNANEGILSEVRVEDELAAEYKENYDNEEASLATQNLNNDRPVLKQQGMHVNGEKSWGNIEDEEDTYSSAMNKEVTLDNKQHNYGESIPVGNGVTIDGIAQLEKFKINSDMGSFGIHSPKKVRNEGLINILQNRMANQTAGQEHSPINNVQQEKTPIQFGSFNSTSNEEQQLVHAAPIHSKQLRDNLKTHEDVQSQQKEHGVIPSIEDHTSQEVTQQADEGWETPKKKHLCRAKNLVSTTQVLQEEDFSQSI
ncbi:hypothetical protein FRX31_017115 [Thalictrum thalictroides]|uniref:Uncharacterized protein n=1 Tax=Thalictrum thalictroides TaxID=46969 RepID=A0A7J6W9N1_THATH|nr:hypothetical protein FRX31_017115 [Thalictrum thalictroides]